MSVSSRAPRLASAPASSSSTSMGLLLSLPRMLRDGAEGAHVVAALAQPQVGGVHRREQAAAQIVAREPFASPPAKTRASPAGHTSLGAWPSTESTMEGTPE